MKSWSVASKLLGLMLIITIILFSLHLVMQHLNLTYNEKQGQIFEISNRLDMDDEASIPTWFAQFVLLCVTGLSFLASALSGSKAKRQVWLFIGISGLLFSIDEVAALHELLLQSLHLVVFGLDPATADTTAWWLILPFVVFIGVMLLRWLYRQLPKRTWMLILTGWTLFVIGAAGFELVSNDFDKRTFYYQGVMTGTEETLELTGSILVLYAAAHYLETHHKSELRRLKEVAIKKLP